MSDITLASASAITKRSSQFLNWRKYSNTKSLIMLTDEAFIARQDSHHNNQENADRCFVPQDDKKEAITRRESSTL